MCVCMCVWSRILLVACSFVLLWSSYRPLPNSGLWSISCFGGQARGWSPCRASPLLWEATFPSSCFLNLHFLHCFIQQGWGPSCEIMDVCRCLKPKVSVAAVTPSLPVGSHFCFLGSLPYCWESHRLPWWNRRVPAPASWCPESELAMFLFQKQRWTWWWDFMVLLMDCYTPGTKWVKEAFWRLAQNLTTMFLGQIDS